MIPNSVKLNKIKNKNISVYNSMKPLLLLHLTFGYDYGLYRSKSVIKNNFIKYFCVILVTAIFLLISYRESSLKTKNFNLHLYPLQYSVEALLIIFSYGTKILNHLKNYDQIDDLLKIDEKYYKSLKKNIIIYIILTLCLCISYILTLCLQIHSFEISYLLLFVLDLSNILRINLFGIIYYRVNLLKKTIENYYGTILNKDRKLNINIDATVFLQIYKLIADQLYDFKSTIDSLVSFLFIYPSILFLCHVFS